MRKIPAIILMVAMLILTAAAARADDMSGNGKAGILVRTGTADLFFMLIGEPSLAHLPRRLLCLRRMTCMRLILLEYRLSP